MLSLLFLVFVLSSFSYAKESIIILNPDEPYILNPQAARTDIVSQTPAASYASSLSSKAFFDVQKVSGQNTPLRVIIRSKSFRLSKASNPVLGIKQSSDETLYDLSGAPVPGKRLSNDFIRLTVHPKQLGVLASDPGVDGIFLDEPVSVLVQDAINITFIYDVLSEGFTGSNVSVCLVDTGVNPDVIGFSEGGNLFSFDMGFGLYDDNGHGTKVAYALTKSAPGIKLISVKAFNSSGIAYSSDILAAFSVCESQKADIISASFGGGLYSGVCSDDVLAQEVDLLSEKNILTVAASGNGGSSFINSPACAASALPVAASTKLGEVALFSNINNLTSLLAPGAAILTMDHLGINTIASGTSMAVPFVVATASLVLENRSLSPYDMKSLIINSAAPLDNNPNLRILNASAALHNITSEFIPPPVYEDNGSADTFFTSAISGQDFNIQRGYAIIPANASSVTISAGSNYTAPLGDAFIRIVNTKLTGNGPTSGGSNNTNNDIKDFSVYISNPDNLAPNITFARNGSENNDARISWEIIDYTGRPGGPNQFIVRDVGTVFFNSTQLSVSGPSVSVINDQDVVVFITGQSGDSVGQGVGTLYSVARFLVSSSNPSFSRKSSGDNLSVSYAVVEFVGSAWRVDYLQHDMTSAGVWEYENLTKSLKNLSRVFLHTQSRPAGTNAKSYDVSHLVQIHNKSALKFFMPAGASASGSRSVTWIIENSYVQGTPMSVQEVTGSRSSGGSEEDVWPESITAVSALNTTSILGESSIYNSSQTLFPAPGVSIYLNSTSSVELIEAETSAYLNYSFFVVQWPAEKNNSPPTHSTPVINASDNPLNRSSANISAFAVLGSDSDGDNITWSFDWRLNAQSIALINMPFNTEIGFLHSQDVKDYSSNSFNGSLGSGYYSMSPVWRPDGIIGGAYSFNGTQLINISSVGSSLSLPITVSFWINPSSITNDQTLWYWGTASGAFGNAIEIRLRQSGIISVIRNSNVDTSVDGTVNISNNNWTYVAVLLNSTNTTIFINGSLDINGGGLSDAALGLLIGNDESASSGLRGLLDELVVYNLSLSSNQIKQLYDDALNFTNKSTIISEHTKHFDNWSIVVTPTDSRDDGISKSSWLIIENTPPTHSTPVINASDNPLNRSSANISVFAQNAADNDNDNISFAFDWRLNGLSISLLNLPFNNDQSDVSSGAIKDLSTYGNNATLGGGLQSSAPLWSSSDVTGGAYVFDGVDDYIVVPNSSSLSQSGSFTVALWVYRNSNSSFSDMRYIEHGNYSSNNGWWLWGEQFGVGNSSDKIIAGSDSSGSVGSWVYLVGVFKSGEYLRLYRNGSLLYSNTSVPVSFSAPSTDLIIGRASYSDADYFNGSVGGVQLFDRALGPDEISNLFYEQDNSLSYSKILSNVTSYGDNWSACVTPNDYYGLSSSAKCSSNITIQAVSNGNSCVQQSDCTSNYCVDSTYEGVLSNKICCGANSCVNSSNECVADGTVSNGNTCFDGVWIAGSGRLEIRNNSDNALLMAIDKYGSMVVRGSYSSSCTSSPSYLAWQVQDLADSTNIWVDTAGDFCVEQSLLEHQSVSCSNCLKVQNTSGSTVAGFDDSGYVYIKGDFASGVTDLS